jgi:hypothetical protein
MWKGISQQFFILQAKFSLAQVATKKQNLLDELKYEREGYRSIETLNCFHSSLDNG